MEKDRHLQKEKELCGQTTSGFELQLFPRSLPRQINLNFGLAKSLQMCEPASQNQSLFVSLSLAIHTQHDGLFLRKSLTNTPTQSGVLP